MNGTAGKATPPRHLAAIYKYRPPDRTPFQKLRYRLSEPDEHGRLKTFRLRHRDNWRNPQSPWIWHVPPNSAGALFNMENVKDGSKDNSPIWSPEGEKDAQSLIDLGLTAVSHWQAAGHFTYEQAVFLAQTKRPIHLLLDRDPPGAVDVLKRLELLNDACLLFSPGTTGRDLLSVWSPLRKEGVKDVSDHLEAGHTMRQLVRVRDLGPVREAAQEARGSGTGAWWGYWVPPEPTEPWHEPEVVRQPDGTRRLSFVVADCSEGPPFYGKEG